MKTQKKMALETTPTTTSTNSKNKKVSKREVEIRRTLAAEEKASHGVEKVEGSFPEAGTAVVEDEEGRGCYGLSNNMGCNYTEDWREWWRPEVLVDEQMSWGSVWFSFWEQENIDCDHAFYSDVMEEDDIWDLRSIKQVPQ